MRLEKLSKITTFIFDVDGVLTNSQVLITQEGHLLRSMNVRDGYAIKVAHQQGFRIIVITGGESQGVLSRLRGLGILEVHTGVLDKDSVYDDILRKHDLENEQVLYMGDDIIDIGCIRKAGVGACPKDAATEVLQVSEYITKRNGGKGCVREMIQMVLELQMKWQPLKA